jgi:hypothetical protein
VQSVALRLEPGQASAERGEPRFELVLFKDTVGITVDETPDAAPQLGDLAVK